MAMKKVSAEKRKNYLKCLEKAKKIESLDSPHERITTLNEVFDKFDCLTLPLQDSQAISPDEGCLRAMVTGASSQALRRIITDYTVIPSTFSITEFAEQLKAQFGQEESRYGWRTLEQYSPNIIRSAPSCSFWLGFDVFGEVEVAAKKSRVARKKDQETEKIKPKNVSNTEPEKGDQYKQVYKALKRSYSQNELRPVNFFKFVLHPDSYPRTMENVFNFSFLIRENLAKIRLDENGQPSTQPLSNKEESQSRERGLTTRQAIVSFDYNTWKSLTEHFKLENSMIADTDEEEVS